MKNNIRLVTQSLMNQSKQALEQYDAIKCGDVYD